MPRKSDVAGKATDDQNSETEVIQEENQKVDQGDATEDSNSERLSEAKTSVKELEEEGDIAADYLEEFLDLYYLDGDIDIDVRDSRAYLAITADEGSNLRLISDPETVDALQELTRLAVQVKTNTFSRLILDIGGSRQARVDDLNRIVTKLIDRVKSSGEAVPMKPMSSYERKIVHDIVSSAGLKSESEGVGKDRHIVIRPAD